MNGKQIPLSFAAFTLKAIDGRLSEIVTDIDVFVSQDITRLFNIPGKSVKVKAIWDTGATSTAISVRLASDLGLIPTGRATVHGVSRSYDTKTYIVDIGLPNKILIQSVQVTEAPNLGEYDALIGMDIITCGDLSITNGSGNTWVSFRYPSDIFQIDYVQKSNEIMKKKVRREKNKQKPKQRHR